ncbi:sarcosine oxidase subunit gamma [Pelagibius marinus]|uniref:sarcosine oxidase subunit gamma n=1 Tax=Pelagibius marinus TaxID=2762760 RepID=UPI001872588F|nr:sarcosine oxidase subunit gamma family protein [Pelagibius marinus]
MIDSYLRQSALDHLGLAGRTSEEPEKAAVRLGEKLLPAAVNLRGDVADPAFVAALREALGVEPPSAPNTVATNGEVALLWLGPDEWLALQHGAAPEAEAQMAAKLRDALGDLHAATTEVGEQYVCIHLAGPKAREVIEKGCPLDLHPRAFGGVGHCAQSHLSKATILLHQVSPGEDGEPAFDLYTRRSFADYLWRWLEDAAGEYGVAIVAP